MPKKPSDITHIISTNQMKDAIKRSGYLLEYRIEQMLREEGYYVDTNPVFPDPETGKSREIDLHALSAITLYKDAYNFIFPFLLCECENNAQPIVFFSKESEISFLHHQEVKVSGIPVKFWQEDGYIGFSEFTGMEKFHHYCKGAVSTQYCTFQLKKDKSSWMALHSEAQHDTFNSLIKALEYEISYHYDVWILPGKDYEKDINIQVYYPLVILQGKLYSAMLKDDHLTLRKAKHIQFRKELFSSRINKVETYQIDVITEEYMKDYLKIIEYELDKVKKVFQRKKAKVLHSMEKIVEEAKKIRKKSESYREALEF